MAYMDGDFELIAEAMNLKQGETGANLMLMKPYDEAVLYTARTVEGIRIVSPFQAYLDLKNYRGRGEEAAEILFREVIKPKW